MVCRQLRFATDTSAQGGWSLGGHAVGEEELTWELVQDVVGAGHLHPLVGFHAAPAQGLPTVHAPGRGLGLAATAGTLQRHPETEQHM